MITYILIHRLLLVTRHLSSDIVVLWNIKKQTLTII